MPVRARWGHQRCDAINQLQRREGQLVCLGSALVTARLAALFGAAVHQGSALFAKAVHGKGWAGAIAQQPLQRGAVVCFNANTRVHRKSAVLVGQHVFGVGLFDQTPADESAQDAPSQVSLRLSHSGGIDSTDQGKDDAWRRRWDIGVARHRLKHPVNNGKDMYIGCKTVRRLDAIGSFESLRAGNLDSEQSATTAYCQFL
jgi:hypothetical protein